MRRAVDEVVIIEGDVCKDKGCKGTSQGRSRNHDRQKPLRKFMGATKKIVAAGLRNTAPDFDF